MRCMVYTLSLVEAELNVNEFFRISLYDYLGKFGRCDGF